MLSRNAFMKVLARRFVRANRIPAVHPPPIPPLPKMGRRDSGEALDAFDPTHCHRGGFWEMPLAKAPLLMLFVALTLAAQARVREVGVIGLTVGNLAGELTFYTNTLPFELVSVYEVGGKEQDALLGLSEVKLRVATLKLGDQRIRLTEHAGRKGSP